VVPLRAVLCDLEGTVAAGQVPIAGAERALAELRERGILLRFLTNIDSQPPDAVRGQLAGVGIEVGADELFTPVIAAQRCFDAVPQDHVFPLVSAALLATFARYDLGRPYVLAKPNCGPLPGNTPQSLANLRQVWIGNCPAHR